ncbi:MAG TPA: hypothetical protein VKF79_10665 [Candidatus Acidoferrum sp.]|nr:hypothetical protein [Candidatus Acidoferrum sp.]
MFATLRGLTLFTASVLSATTIATAQTPAPSAPLPAQLSTAKKIFLSNASGKSYSGMAASDLTYNDFHSALKSWGRYELASTPSDADMIFEIRYEAPFGPSNGGNSVEFPEAMLVIFDPKTHVVLWAFSEPLVSTKHKSNEQHLADTLNNLLNDVKRLVALAEANNASSRK